MSDRHHNQMEPHVTLAVWDDGGTLTLYDSTQMVVGTKKLVSLVLGIPRGESQRRVRVPRRRIRRQVLVVAAHSAGRARRESGEQAGPLAA